MVVSSFMFFQCTSEYTPIAGIDGKDGVDGVDGIDGSDADAALCIQCHANEHRDPIINAYATSAMPHQDMLQVAHGPEEQVLVAHNVTTMKVTSIIYQTTSSKLTQTL